MNEYTFKFVKRSKNILKIFDLMSTNENLTTLHWCVRENELLFFSFLLSFFIHKMDLSEQGSYKKRKAYNLISTSFSIRRSSSCSTTSIWLFGKRSYFVQIRFVDEFNKKKTWLFLFLRLVRSEKDLENDELDFPPEFTHQIFGEK